MWRTRRVSLLLLLLLPVAGLALVLWLCRCAQGHRRQERRGDDKGTLRVRQSVTSELTIPGDVVGRVIGRHGLRVRQLEEESGARIKFKDQQQSRDKVGRHLSEHLGNRSMVIVCPIGEQGTLYEQVTV